MRHDPDNPYIPMQHRVALYVRARIVAQDRRNAERAKAAARASSPEEIAADVIPEIELERGEGERIDDYSSVRDEAALAGGMIHLRGWLLTRQPAVTLHHGRVEVPSGTPCLINGWQSPEPGKEKRSKEWREWKRKNRKRRRR